jgi:hypothetical protein
MNTTKIDLSPADRQRLAALAAIEGIDTLELIQRAVQAELDRSGIGAEVVAVAWRPDN